MNGSLTASQVTLVANAGAVDVNGAITANGTATAAGGIGLYGTSGVDVEGTLMATGSPNSQKPGGVINIGTSGVGSTTSLNSTYGYENVTSSGVITVGANAKIDASGGTVTFRAPILDANNAQGSNVNIVIVPGAKVYGGAVNLDAYAVWSTADQSTNPNEHFDGIVDPAGWYQPAGPHGAPQLVAGTFTDVNGNTITYTPGTYVPATSTTAAYWTPATLSNAPGATWQQIKADLASDLENDYFMPNASGYNSAHAAFYGGYDPNTESFNPSSPDKGSLPYYIQNPGLSLGNVFAGIANFQARPEVDLVNPSVANGGVNGGTITVVTNWNLGAGVMNNDGSITLAYRYQDAIAPVIALRAAGDVRVDASITDGASKPRQ